MLLCSNIWQMVTLTVIAKYFQNAVLTLAFKTLNRNPAKAALTATDNRTDADRVLQGHWNAFGWIYLLDQ